MEEEIVKPVIEDYGDDSIVHLEDMEHIRLRPGMYIGKLGDGSSHDDGIYVLIKEVIDNSIDEFSSGYGKRINVKIDFGERKVTIRDFGRGIPLGKLVEAVSKLNTGAKYDSKVFQKSVGLNGVGTKAVNALSSYFKAMAVRDGRCRIAEFSEGKLEQDSQYGCETAAGYYVYKRYFPLMLYMEQSGDVLTRKRKPHSHAINLMIKI